MSLLKTWRDYPRKKEKLIIVGMNHHTRDATPWDDPDAEIWILNEMYHYPFTKRWDRMFQIHQRWDFMRTNNFNDPNHPYWLQNIKGVCHFCNGEGRVILAGKEGKCPECKEGIYTPPSDREGRIIYMQEAWDDIPGAVKFPMDEVTAIYCQDEIPYFTSTISMMLALAFLMEYREINLYGFEMGTGTEYHYQRVCAEYWVGYGRGRGVNITAPGADILKGALYAYENLRTGFRQQLEMRKGHLETQIKEAAHVAAIAQGKVEGLMPLQDHPDVKELYQQAFDVHYKTKSFLNFLNGTLKEVENMVGLYDTYFIENMSNEKGEAMPYKQATKHIGLMYQMG
jgi:hypothetical protein